MLQKILPTCTLPQKVEAHLDLQHQKYGSRNRIRDPTGTDGTGHIGPNRDSNNRRGQHLHRDRNHRQKRSYGEPARHLFPTRLPQARVQQAVTDPTVQPRAAHLFEPRHVPQIFTRVGAAPEMWFQINETINTDENVLQP